MALQNENLLYALLALSATQLSSTYPNDVELSRAREDYWNMALREQAMAVENRDLSAATVSSFAAFLISVNAFAKVQERNLEHGMARRWKKRHDADATKRTPRFQI